MRIELNRCSARRGRRVPVVLELTKGTKSGHDVVHLQLRGELPSSDYFRMSFWVTAVEFNALRDDLSAFSRAMNLEPRPEDEFR